jgi:teichoic acid transport system permease protein
MVLRRVRIFLQEYLNRRELIRQLTIRDFRARYAGSWLGLFWAICQPLAMMCILWFVFSYGLKAGPQGNVNFVCWFFTANIPWLFLNEAINNVTNVYHEYAFLVKKVNFRLAILPLIKILSANGLECFELVNDACIFRVVPSPQHKFVGDCLLETAVRHERI